MGNFSECGDSSQKKEALPSAVSLYAGVPLVVAAGTCIYFYSQMKTAVEQRSAHAYVVNGSFDLTGSDDTFVTSYQTRTLVETDDDDKR